MIMFAIGHHKSYARDQTRDDSPEQRHSMPHVVQHTICATRKQRLVPTRRMRGWDNKRVANGVEKSHDGTRKKREHQLVVLQPTNTENDANLFHECPIATRHPVQGLGSKVHTPAPGTI